MSISNLLQPNGFNLYCNDLTVEGSITAGTYEIDNLSLNNLTVNGTLTAGTTNFGMGGVVTLAAGTALNVNGNQNIGNGNVTNYVLGSHLNIYGNETIEGSAIVNNAVGSQIFNNGVITNDSTCVITSLPGASANFDGGSFTNFLTNSNLNLSGNVNFTNAIVTLPTQSLVSLPIFYNNNTEITNTGLTATIGFENFGPIKIVLIPQFILTDPVGGTSGYGYFVIPLIGLNAQFNPTALITQSCIVFNGLGGAPLPAGSFQQIGFLLMNNATSPPQLEIHATGNANDYVGAPYLGQFTGSPGQPQGLAGPCSMIYY